MTGNSNSMCLVDERVFKIPSSYRCTNHYLPSGIESNFIQDGDQRNGAALNDNRRHNYGQPVDDDEILLQLAIQQSLAMINNNPNTNNNNSNEETAGGEGAESGAGDQLTALDFIGYRPATNTSGATQSLEEYHVRRNNRMQLNNTEDDLILQRYMRCIRNVSFYVCLSATF